MMTKFSINAMNRRQFLSTTAAATIMAGVSMPKVAFAEDKVVKIGFLAPLTGEVAAWGKPGLDGLHIWADWVNAAGGVPMGGENYKVEFVAYDDEYDPGKARTGAVKLIKEDGVKFIMMLGGDLCPGRFARKAVGRDLSRRLRGCRHQGSRRSDLL
jgi:branched-chain amino acid transport system substrate-binding protein